MDEEEFVKTLDEVLAPYIETLVKNAVGAFSSVEDATFASFTQLVCVQLEITVRQMVKEINASMRSKDYERVRKFIRQHPRIARRATDYVAKAIRYKVRKMLREELKRQENEAKKRKP